MRLEGIQRRDVRDDFYVFEHHKLYREIEERNIMKLAEEGKSSINPG